MLVLVRETLLKALLLLPLILMGDQYVILAWLICISSTSKEITILCDLINPFNLIFVDIDAAWVIAEHALYVRLLVLLLEALPTLLCKLGANLINLGLVVTVAVEKRRIDLSVNDGLD